MAWSQIFPCFEAWFWLSLKLYKESKKDIPYTWQRWVASSTHTLVNLTSHDNITAGWKCLTLNDMLRLLPKPQMTKVITKIQPPFAVNWWPASYTSRNPCLENSLFTGMVGNADKWFAQNKGYRSLHVLPATNTFGNETVTTMGAKICVKSLLHWRCWMNSLHVLHKNMSTKTLTFNTGHSQIEGQEHFCLT